MKATTKILVVCLLASTGCFAADMEDLHASNTAVSAQPSVHSAAYQLQSDILRINSNRKNPDKQKFTDISEAVEKDIPVGSSIEGANALILAMGCQPPLRLKAGESPPHGYKRPRCTSAGVTTNSDTSLSVGALVELPGRFLVGHWLTIHAQAGSDQTITSVTGTIDIRTPGD